MNKIATYYSQLAYQAMITEVELTPKPGLVDLVSHGAHCDMTAHHFYLSAGAIAPYLKESVEFGLTLSMLTPDQVLPAIRPLGIACEQAMYKVTKGINTHKGAIFSLTLIGVAIGRLSALQYDLTPVAICQQVSAYCQGLVQRELRDHNLQQTAGQHLFSQYGLTGARGEAESGFATVRLYALPYYLHYQQQYGCSERALHAVLLQLLRHNQDTNVVARAGLAGLQWLQHYAEQLLQQGGVSQPDYLSRLAKFDKACIAKNISPGGSADLLIVTWLLTNFNWPKVIIASER